MFCSSDARHSGTPLTRNNARKNKQRTLKLRSKNFKRTGETAKEEVEEEDAKWEFSLREPFRLKPRSLGTTAALFPLSPNDPRPRALSDKRQAGDDEEGPSRA